MDLKSSILALCENKMLKFTQRCQSKYQTEQKNDRTYQVLPHLDLRCQKAMKDLCELCPCRWCCSWLLCSFSQASGLDTRKKLLFLAKPRLIVQPSIYKYVNMSSTRHNTGCLYTLRRSGEEVSAPLAPPFPKLYF